MPSEVTPPQAKEAIAVRQERQKELIVEQLRKTPIVQIACEKVDISRATYYRWRKDDKDFARAADEAIHSGVQLVNDMAESQLLAAIRDQNMTAIIFWLKSRHPAYTTRLQVTAKTDNDDPLTPEQEEIIKEALRRSSLLPTPPTNGKHSA